MPNMIASCTFNPPVINLIGETLRETTIDRLNLLFKSTTTIAAHRNAPPKFEERFNPHHWHLALSGQFCDQLGRAVVLMDLVQALEAEDWKLKASNAFIHPETGLDTSKLFFVRE
eukprot:NODE_7594_length_461_cov_25.531553_g7147_i0.p1 GENE.NODE_7594_length_461_cov_25.531553_g7147_i0~~NODE_7594_length_461_cov_25.531553_g7147_i0.p1  ORF type:complete len:128 (+),score=24.76 NODE_7594_length_461_cov_25.531553_g7147_i0:42-386(+)